MFVHCLFAQIDSARLIGIATKLESQYIAQPVEKVYLHFNKASYAAGDTIWFKSYLTVGKNHLPSALSNVVRVSLLDNLGKAISSIKVQNDGGVGTGSVVLPGDLPPGVYHVCAYTNWMRNAAPAYFFNQVLYINGTVLPDTQPAKTQVYAKGQQSTSTSPVSGLIDIQFFPEGGQMVNDVRSKVAFKAVGANGLGVDVSGVIVDNDNKEIAFFNATHAGMGVFALTPEAGKTYTAKINSPQGSNVFIKLPNAVSKGFVLSVNTRDSANIVLNITCNEATLQQKLNQSFYVVGQNGGSVYYTTAGILSQRGVSAIIPKSKFPSGIAQFTFFGSDGEPLNERIVFISNPADIVNVGLSLNKGVYGAKEKVTLNLTAHDFQQKPVEGNFSAAVYYDDGIADENSILAQILLKSDLKGYIENPDYYFKGANGQYRADLDLLMLTQGYRRFEWKTLLAGKRPEVLYQPEKVLSISGVLMEKKKPVQHGTLGVLSFDDKQYLKTTTDEKGRFKLDSLNFRDGANLALQAHTASGGNKVNIIVDKEFAPDSALISERVALGDVTNIAKISAADFEKQHGQEKENIVLSKNNKLLKDVTVKGTSTHQGQNAPWNPVVKQSANLNGPGQANMIFSSKDFEACSDILACIINRIPGITKQGDNYVLGRHQSQSVTAVPPVNFMLDGVFVSSDQLSFINPNQVATVEVLSSSSYLAIYGSTADGGLIIVTTKTGTDGVDYNKIEGLGTSVSKFNGFNKARNFYVPKYTPANMGRPDHRDAIYWDPTWITNDKGAATASFFNSDVKGNYRVVVEGIDNDGKLAHIVYRYKVE